MMEIVVDKKYKINENTDFYHYSRQIFDDWFFTKEIGSSIVFKFEEGKGEIENE